MTVRAMWQLPCIDNWCSDISSCEILISLNTNALSGNTDQAVQSIGGKTGYLLHISWLKAAKARLMLERMSLGGSLEILIQVCRMDSGTILACKSCEAKVRQAVQPRCAARQRSLERFTMSHAHIHQSATGMPCRPATTVVKAKNEQHPALHVI